MNTFIKILREVARPQIYGMIHVDALPGTPLSAKPIGEICRKVRSEAKTYAECGVDGIIVENMHDIPYTTKLGPEVIACMTRACQDAGKTAREINSKISCGVQILAAANREALSVAYASDFDFVRVEGFIFAHVADEGLIRACAGDLLRYRKAIGADRVSILADIKKKHSSHSITSDVSIEETAKAAEFFLADGVIITGSATGDAASIDEFNAVRNASHIPVLIGSGITTKNAKRYREANAFIVGTYFKKDGRWQNELNAERIKQLVKFVKNDFKY